MSSTETRQDTITWHESLETYLRSAGEKAHGLSWLQEFKTRFSKVADIAQPEEANGLEKITVYANPLSA
jgi:hypothetical protein